MTVRLGKVELTRVQSISTEESRNLVEHRMPGHSGSLQQDLGRGPVVLRVAGLALGEKSIEELEVLRKAHEEALPLPLVADIATGTPVDDVVIDGFAVEEVAGFAGRYGYRLVLREYVPPPQPPKRTISAQAKAATAAAEAWAEQAVGNATDEVASGSDSYELTIHLKDFKGAPVAGETLWLVHNETGQVYPAAMSDGIATVTNLPAGTYSILPITKVD